ncbi:MAG: response regulator [Sulfurimonadaceae bacterium]|nr:response regulator [Sulfurimonadaceae bacterium]
MYHETIKKFTILLVDDEIDIQNALGTLLKMWTPNVLIAGNGEEGLKLYEEEKPDIIITDIRMPVMNGLEMIRKIRQSDINIPIIITTAFDEGAYLFEAMEMHVDRYLLKPIVKKDLKHTLDHVARSLLFEQQHRLLQAMIDADPSAIAACSDNEILYTNETFRSLFGSEPESYDAAFRSACEEVLTSNGVSYGVKVYAAMAELVDNGNLDLTDVLSAEQSPRLLSITSTDSDIMIFRISEKCGV